jgi:hypothetical protein
MTDIMLGHPYPMASPILKCLQQGGNIINSVDLKWALEFMIGPSNKLHIVSIDNLCVIVGIVHKGFPRLRNHFCQVVLVQGKGGMYM